MPLVAHYPLQEDSGSTAYDVAGSNNGTNSGATVGANGVLGGNAYSFNSSNGDYINCPDLSLGSKFTVSYWTNADTINSSRDVCVGGYDTDTGSWQFILGFESGVFKYGQNDGSASPERTFGSPTTGTWYHVVASGDGSTTRLYVDGVEMASGSVSGFNSTPFEPHIGSWDSSGNYFDGRIADVRIYDHTLSSSEVQYLYDVGSSGSLTTQFKSV